jgi:hypothetical protein
MRIFRERVSGDVPEPNRGGKLREDGDTKVAHMDGTTTNHHGHQARALAGDSLSENPGS